MGLHHRLNGSSNASRFTVNHVLLHKYFIHTSPSLLGLWVNTLGNVLGPRATVTNQRQLRFNSRFGDLFLLHVRVPCECEGWHVKLACAPTPDVHPVSRKDLQTAWGACTSRLRLTKYLMLEGQYFVNPWDL